MNGNGWLQSQKVVDHLEHSIDPILSAWLLLRLGEPKQLGHSLFSQNCKVLNVLKRYFSILEYGLKMF
jgi:hypothetical protein